MTDAGAALIQSFHVVPKGLPPEPGRMHREIRCHKCGGLGHIQTDPACPLSARRKLQMEETKRLDPSSGLQITQLDPASGMQLKQMVLPRETSKRYDLIIPDTTDEDDRFKDAIRGFTEDERRRLMEMLRADINGGVGAEMGVGYEDDGEEEGEEEEEEEEEETRQAAQAPKRSHHHHRHRHHHRKGDKEEEPKGPIDRERSPARR